MRQGKARQGKARKKKKARLLDMYPDNKYEL